jgi:hypothetical protein
MNKIDKLTKQLGIEKVKELEALSKEHLEQVIITAEKAMKLAKEEIEANPRYQELKESLGALTAGLKEVNGRQRALIQMALILLGE